MTEKGGLQARTLEQQIEEMLDVPSPTPKKSVAPPGPRKFNRIRTFVQKLNEEVLATIYEAEQRHQAQVQELSTQMDTKVAEAERLRCTEIQKLTESLEVKEETVMALQRKLEELSTKEQEFTDFEKSSSEKIRKLEASDNGQKNYVKQLRESLEAQEEKTMILQQKIDSLLSKEQEHLELVKQASDKIRKLEALEESHKNYVKLAGDKISDLTAEEKKREQVANEKIKTMEAREEKVVSLAKKAALRIKDLESRNKVKAANLKKASEAIQELKQMLLGKQDDLEAVQTKTLEHFDTLAEEVEELDRERASFRASLAEAQDQYLEENALRKADLKKISSLRKMIEQYDGDGDSNCSNLSQALSAEEDMNPLTIYRESCAVTQEDFETLRAQIFEAIPDSIKKNYTQVGFFRTNEFYFPVLALGPFDVPPGPIRKKWLGQATTLLGVYYYGQEDEALAYDMIPCESFIPYDEGVAEGFHIIPANITEKEESGEELAPIEQLFKNGIEKINAEAKAEPEARSHMLKNFKESFELQGTKHNSALDNSKALREEIQEFIGSVAKREALVERLDKIPADELFEAKRKKPKKKILKIDVDRKADDSASCADSAETPSSTWSAESSVASLEEQMYSFMKELSSTNRKSPKKARRLEKCQEETREQVEDPKSAPSNEEVRDDAEQEGAAERRLSFKERLQMFGGHHVKANYNKCASAGIVNSNNNTKNVMQMWKQKTTVTTASPNNTGNNTGSSHNTPKQDNKKAFNFDDAHKGENAEVSAKEVAAPRFVTIPKNILKKIEAGEALTDHEKEILDDIQKANQLDTVPSDTSSQSIESDGKETAESSKHANNEMEVTAE